MDQDDLYIEYDELVESGEIDPQEISVEDWVTDRISELTDRAMDYMDMDR